MEEITAKWILINNGTGQYYEKHNSDSEPRNGEPNKITWVEWNKPLPDDIDTAVYKLIDGELIKQ